MKIPIKYIETCRPSRRRKVTPILTKTPLVYGDTPKKLVDVVGWFRWPAYDFIFGVPSRTHRLYGAEAGFFTYRDTRTRKVACGFYVDMNELKLLVEGFSKILKRAKQVKRRKAKW